MPLTGKTIETALAAIGARGKQIRSYDELAAGAAGALRQAPDGLTAAGAASFLATTAQESAYYRTTREYGSGQWYAPWIGRGFVQVTHEANYRAFGAWCRRRGLVDDPDVFVKNRAALEEYRWAWLTAVWYFEETRLWDWANAGDHLRVSQAVNGGRGRAGTKFIPNHWPERWAMFEAFRKAGDALLPGPGAAAARTVAQTPETPARRPRGDDMLIYTAQPPKDAAKWDWPTQRVPFAFDPAGGWGGKVILKVDHGGRGGWIHLLRWWIRDPKWTPERPVHFAKDHPVGSSQGRAGSERFVGYGWQSAPPAGADQLEIVLSAPDGVHIQSVYEK